MISDALTFLSSPPAPPPPHIKHICIFLHTKVAHVFNSLAPGRSECDYKNGIFNLVLLTVIFRSSHDNALQWMPQELTDDKSTLVQVMVWCRQATSHYLSQCWPRSLLPYVVTRPQWVKTIPHVRQWDIYLMCEIPWLLMDYLCKEPEPQTKILQNLSLRRVWRDIVYCNNLFWYCWDIGENIWKLLHTWFRLYISILSLLPLSGWTFNLRLFLPSGIMEYSWQEVQHMAAS